MPGTTPINGNGMQPHKSIRNHVRRYDFALSDYPSRSESLLKRLITTPQNGTSGPKQAEIPLHIIVVGAGLGSLATSIALAHRGHKVTVLEQARKLGEVGAGIQIPPNSARLLKSWVIDPFFDGKVVNPESMTDTYNAPYYVIHRADFHMSLHQLALQLGVEVIIDSKVNSYDDETATVRTTKGAEFTADLLVAVDGVKSAARPVVLGGTDQPPKLTGFAAYQRSGLNIWIGEDCHVMTYCIAGGKTFNMVLSHMDHSDPSNWSNDTAVADMRDNFAGWDPKLNKVIHLIESTMKCPLMNGARLSTWISKNKRLVIFGDAAHAMVPYMSQGAAMAVEDGAALAEALSLISSNDDVRLTLKVFEEVRIKRSYEMQSASLVNGVLWHYPDGPEQQARDRGMSTEVEGRPFVESTNQWSDPVTQLWAYGYDAEKAVIDT
ncbi:hypothetical protein QBC36DRAFT_365923 [Triangularia setosa]|uniref:FAD-binding domain-containing protein n=1 Tax=Triangularia setosa TaxID=2587417 RepID=A0AAN6VZT7_9PEZI|nr:hypothetical protein QBC36DRAFT_365923 [Podospora setosa]